MEFHQTDAHAVLDSSSELELDAMPFGVVRLDRAGVVLASNSIERQASGLRPAHMIGRHFFTQVAPCMNTALVARRYATEPELDATFDYLLALRMKSTAVRLRLLQSAASPNAYVLVAR
jgi:photoactive yellow protein